MTGSHNDAKSPPNADVQRAVMFCGLFIQHFMSGLADGGGIQAVLTQQVPGRARAAELVLHAHTAHGGGQLLRENCAHSFAQTADLFLGEYKGGLIDQIAIDKY